MKLLWKLKVKIHKALWIIGIRTAFNANFYRDPADGKIRALYQVLDTKTAREVKRDAARASGRLDTSQTLCVGSRNERRVARKLERRRGTLCSIHVNSACDCAASAPWRQKA